MEAHYGQLSEQYASFLAALGGVSITVLTLVLSLNKRRGRGRALPYLVASLVVATLTCFMGAHLMAETSAFVSKFSEDVSGGRLFLLASVNIFVAVLLLLFTLSLLPVAFRSGRSPGVMTVSKLSFLAVNLCVFIWMFLGLGFRFQVSNGWAWGLSGAVMGVVLWGGVFSWSRRREPPAAGARTESRLLGKPRPRPAGARAESRFLVGAFTMIIIFVTGSLALFTLTFRKGMRIAGWEVAFFGLTVMFSVMALAHSWCRLVKPRRQRPASIVSPSVVENA